MTLTARSTTTELAAGAVPTTDDILALFRANGGRVTAGRRAVIDVLLAGRDHRHLTADGFAISREHFAILGKCQRCRTSQV